MFAVGPGPDEGRAESVLGRRCGFLSHVLLLPGCGGGSGSDHGGIELAHVGSLFVLEGFVLVIIICCSWTLVNLDIAVLILEVPCEPRSVVH